MDLKAVISSFALASPANVTSAVQAKGVGADSKEDKGKKKTENPVSVQVPDSELNKFLSTLSTGCSGRFRQMLLGKGGDLHTFGTAKVEANSDSCAKLEG